MATFSKANKKIVLRNTGGEKLLRTWHVILRGVSSTPSQQERRSHCSAGVFGRAGEVATTTWNFVVCDHNMSMLYFDWSMPKTVEQKGITLFLNTASYAMDLYMAFGDCIIADSFQKNKWSSARRYRNLLFFRIIPKYTSSNFYL